MKSLGEGIRGSVCERRLLRPAKTGAVEKFDVAVNKDTDTVMRRLEVYVGKRVMVMDGRLKLRWMDSNLEATASSGTPILWWEEMRMKLTKKII